MDTSSTNVFLMQDLLTHLQGQHKELDYPEGALMNHCSFELKVAG